MTPHVAAPARRRIVDELEGLGHRAVTEHLTRARIALEAADYDALLVLSDASLATRGHVGYFTDYETLTYWSAVVLTPDEVVLFVPQPVACEWALLQAAPETVVVGVAPTLPALAQAIESRVGARKVGIANASRLSLASNFTTGIAALSADDDLRSLTFTKCAADLELVEASLAIVSETFMRVPELIVGRVTERELRAEMNGALEAAGLTPGLTLLTTNRAEIPAPRPSSSRRISDGVLTLSLEPETRTGLLTQTVRLFVAGEASEELREGVAVARATIDTTAARARDNEPVGQMAATALSAIPDGWQLSSRAPLGHTLGWIVGDTPKLDPGETTRIAAPAVFAIHPLVADRSGLGVFLGDTIVIEKTGARFPCSVPDLIEVAVP